MTHTQFLFQNNRGLLFKHSRRLNYDLKRCHSLADMLFTVSSSLVIQNTHLKYLNIHNSFQNKALIIQVIIPIYKIVSIRLTIHESQRARVCVKLIWIIEKFFQSQLSPYLVFLFLSLSLTWKHLVRSFIYTIQSSGEITTTGSQFRQTISFRVTIQLTQHTLIVIFPKIRHTLAIPNLNYVPPGSWAPIHTFTQDRLNPIINMILEILFLTQ